MKSKISTAAAELLRLEKTQNVRALSLEEQALWEILVSQIFNSNYGDGSGRKTFRLLNNSKCIIRINGNAVHGEILDVSLRGFSIECSNNLILGSSDFLFQLESVFFEGQPVRLDLECQTINFAKMASTQKFGALITNRNSEEVLQLYIDCIYYPSYIAHLEDLTKTE